jgi:molybdenum cofactor cytidylyltransferase
LVNAVILAAGAGSRMGGVAKALLRIDDTTYLSRILATARADDAVVVVAAPFGDAVATEARRLGARVVVNPDPARGMASSVALGFGALRDGDAAWLWPVDHPHVTVETLRALQAAVADHDVARPRYQGRGGHPPLIARKAWPRLAACDGVDGGARAILAALDVVDVAVDDAGVVRDIDTPEDAT